LLEARNYLLNFKDGHEKLRAVFCWVQPSVSELHTAKQVDMVL